MWRSSPPSNPQKASCHGDKESTWHGPFTSNYLMMLKIILRETHTEYIRQVAEENILT